MRALPIVVVLTRVAAADPPPSPPPIPAHPWSWAPLVAILGDGKEGLFGAEIRVRHSTEADFAASTISLGVDTREFHTFEPYVMFGADTLHQAHPAYCCRRGLTFADLHVGIGGGYDHEGFVLGRLTAGVIFAPIAEGHYPAGYATGNRYRLTSQADFALELKASNGELRVSFGVELDPFRVVRDFVKLWW